MFNDGMKRPQCRGAGGVDEPLIQKSFSSKTAEYMWEKSRLAFFTVMLLLTSVGNTVYFKRMTNAMPNYGWYLTQLSTVIYIPFFAFLSGTGVILRTKQELVRKFAIMGLCDGLSGTLMVLGGVHTSGTMQVLLSQAVIPLTMVFSLSMIGKRFHILQQVGAAIIVLGIMLAKAGGRGSAGESDNVIFNLLFVLSIVPNALSSVFKEVAFRGFDGDLDVNVLQFWVATFQVMVNFLGMPIYALKMLGPQQVPLSQMPGQSVDGTMCLFFLEDQVLDDCGLPEEKPCDHCREAWVPVFVYLAFNLFFNIFTMLVIKHGSATLSFLVSTLRMPLSSLAFSSTLIMGSEAVQPGMSDFVSLVVILCGLVSYRCGGKLLKRQPEGDVFAPASPQSPPWPSPTDTASAAVRRGISSSWKFKPIFTPGTVGLQPTFVLVREPRPQPRTADRVRDDFYRRLGAASPLHSPRFRDRPFGPSSVCTAVAPSGSQSSATGAGNPASFLSPKSHGESEDSYGDMDIAIVGLPPQANKA